MTGTRNGVQWPVPGGEIDLPEREARRLLDQGMADLPGDDNTARRRAQRGTWAFRSQPSGVAD